MSNITYYISNLLEKMTSTDKDFRFMATNDLMMELQKDSIKLDEDSERKVVTMLLKLLEDKNGEVQNLAVKCLGPLVSKVKEYQVETMVDTLCSNMVSDKEQLRDISSMGLKTVIAELPPPRTPITLIHHCLQEILLAVLMFYGVFRLSSTLVSFHQSILTSLLPQLTSPRMAVRKRAIIALGHLVPSCSPALFTQLTEHLMGEMTRGGATANTRTYIQCLTTVIRQGGHRVGETEPQFQCLYEFIQLSSGNSRRRLFIGVSSALLFLNYRKIQSRKNVIKALHKQLKEKSMKSRQGCFSILTEMANVLPGALGEHIPNLIPGIVYSLTDKSTSSNMKIDALAFLHVLLSGHTPEVFQPHIKIILPPVITCVEDPFYKITSEALQVTQQICRIMRPLEKRSSSSFDAKPYVKEVFGSTLKRLKAADIDQEVKERAISCMGYIVSHLGDQLGGDLQPTLQIFLERLKNEITRLTAVKTLSLIAGSSLKIDLRSILTEGIPILGSFLRKNQRALKLNTLTALNIIVTNYSDCLKPAMIESVLSELPALIQENDMHVSQMAIGLLTCMAKVCPSSLGKIGAAILPEVLHLVHSPLLQGGALSSIVEFFHALVLTKASNTGYSDLMKALTGPFYKSKSPDSLSVHRQSYYSVAKCVAALSSSCPKEASGTVANFIQEVKNQKTSESVRILSFLCLGEVGRSTNLGGHKELKTVIMEAFSSPNEEVKSAASCALGNICVGNLEEYLPFLLKEIGAQPKRQYLLLHSLKEVISALSEESLKPHVENIWTLLFKNCECGEEGTRNVVAECLGKLTLVNPALLLPRLKKQLSSGSSLARSTVVTAVKFTIVDHPVPIDSLLKDSIGDFLKTIQDPDLNVRRVALVMFNSAAHNKPGLIRGLLTSVLPKLYNETQIRKELIREVEMGPFKHTVDDGLDVRKAAFECMYTLLDSCLDCLDIFEFLNHVEEGLKDHYDIRMLTFIMLARLASLCPSAVVQRLDRLVEPLRATCTTKVKAGSVKQEFEKQEELRRSAMRAVAALLSISDVEKSPVMADFANQIRTNAEMATIFESVQGDPISGAVESMDTS
uniref:Cullin-associated and neddylation-dissociated 2 (putative) n=1 Tax=Astyanax mexicanus TaxID=7994 RepID=A0A8B9JT49_ASTMX